MNRRSKIIAVSLCAAQIVAMIPVTASAANSGVSVDTIAAGENHSLVIKSDMSWRQQQGAAWYRLRRERIQRKESHG